MRRPVSFVTGALLLFIIGAVPSRSFSQDLPGFPTATETGTAIHDGSWRQLFVSGQPFAAETPATATVAEAAPASQPAAPPAEPQHTGFQALIRTVGSDFVALPKRRSTWVFVGIGAGGALLAHPADDNVNARLVGSPGVGRFFAPGKWLGASSTQLGLSVGLYVVGRYVMPHGEGEGKTNKVSHLGYDLLRAQIVSQVLVQGIKIAARRDRPTGECCSFPSGHAATAFAVASVLERHLGYRAAWPTLLAATYVGASRLHDNRHFLSDVVFGSAIGMATGWTIVGRHGRSDYALLPVPVRGGFAVNLTRAPQHGD
jgi:membrane-associated phospholipid phosphatase